MGKMPYLASSVSTSTSSIKRFDEKHYFLIPYKLSPTAYVFYSMRVLPDGISEINDLPKKRIFHFPNANYQKLAEGILTREARDQLEEAHYSGEKDENSLVQLANDIDKVDTKITGGFLLVGGLVALLNPLAGIGLAASAIIPGLGGYLSKKGLRNLGDRVTENNLRKEIKEAEEKILAEFRDADTDQVINPILHELEIALATDKSEHKPLEDFDLHSQLFSGRDNARFIHLTSKAICDSYAPLLKKRKLWKEACLGVEDIEWLESLKQSVAAKEKLLNSPEKIKWRQLKVITEGRLIELKAIKSLDLLHDIDQQLEYIQSFTAGRRSLVASQDDLCRIAYKFLPELLSEFNQIPVEQITSTLEDHSQTVEEVFHKKLLLIKEQMLRLEGLLFENKLREFNDLATFLGHKLDPQKIDIDSG